jgi:peptide/nickel transport system substrate-binding protein
MDHTGRDQAEEKSSGFEYALSRRRALGWSGLALGSFLAGCGGGTTGDGGGGGDTTQEGDGGEDGGDGEDTTEVESPDVIHGVINTLPADINMVDPSNTLREWRYRWWAYNRGDGEVIKNLGKYGGIAKDYGYDQEEGALWMEMEEGYSWWDGTPLTAKHAYYNDDSSWIVWRKRQLRAEGEDIEKRKPELSSDGYKVTLYKPTSHWGKKNKEHAIDEVGNWETLGHPETKRPMIEDLEDASTGDEVDNIEDKYSFENTGGLGLDEKKPKFYGDIKGKNVGNSPYRIDSWSETTITLKPWEEDPAVKAGVLPVDTIKLHVAKGTDKQNQLLINDVLDLKTPDPSIRSQVPEHIKEAKQWPYYVIQKVMLNWDNKHLGNRAFRRALWYLVDQEQISENVTFKNRPAKMNGYLPPRPAERWLNGMWDTNYREKLIDYGTTSNTERATEYMEKAGYSKQGGDLVDPDGETVSLDLLANNFNTLTAEILKGQFESFGITVQPNVIGDPAAFSDRVENEKFDMGIHVAGAYGLVTHPWWWLRTAWDGQAMHIGNPYDDEYKENPREYGAKGKKAIQALPKEVGPTEIEGEGREVDLVDRCYTGLIFGPSEEQKTRALDGSHYFNFYAHAIPLHQLVEGYGGDTKHFDFPTDESAVIRHGAIQQVKSGGRITPKGK